MSSPGTGNTEDATTLRSGEVETLGHYLRGWIKKLRSGDSGILPVLGGLVVLAVIFQIKSSVFLSAGNLTNLFVQGAVFVMLGMAEIWILLLGDIDLSTGFELGVAGTIGATLLTDGWPWWVCVLAAILASAALGAVWGIIIVRFNLPSFVVTLAGQLGLNGLLIYLINLSNSGGVIRVSNAEILDICNGSLSPVAGWIVTIVVLVGFAAMSLQRNAAKLKAGLVSPPRTIILFEIALAAAAGIAINLLCDINRGIFISIRGVPWVIPIVLAVLGIYTFVLGRTKFGRYIYAMGGNREAARRAGINIRMIRIAAFALTGLTAGIAGIIYDSQLSGISSDVDGGQFVLYAVAAAVIGGTSLFGGRGKMVHAFIGGIIIATIYNGMGLIGLSAAAQYMVTALVLLAAVVLDALVSRRRTA